MSASAPRTRRTFEAYIVSQAVTPAVTSPALGAGSGAGGPALSYQTFVLTFSDPLGAGDVGGVLGLWSNDASQLNTAAPLANSQCAIGNYTVTPAGNSVTFTVSIDFVTPFEGSQELYALAAANSTGNYAPWIDLGAWNVLAPTTQTRIYSSPGTYTWTAPTGVTSTQVEAWGPGGNGANAVYFSGYQYVAGGGGGGGAYAKKTAASVSPGQSYTIVVGAGGAATRSTFGGNVAVADYGVNGGQAIGGAAPGVGGPGGQAANSVGDVVQSGGNATGGSNPWGGSGGAGANGGAGGLYGDGNGTPGSSPGGGGGGAGQGTVSYSGGPGANGQVMLTYGGPATTTYGITGTVTASGAPLIGVTLNLTGSQTATVTTDANGNYGLFNLAAGGTYTVTASMMGYSLSNAQTFSNLAANQTANFTATQTTAYYMLTASVSPSGGGTISVSPACCSYAGGTQVTITASPAGGYQFSGFTGIDSSNGAVGYVTMNSNRSVTAAFAVIPAGLTITTGPALNGAPSTPFSQTLTASGGYPPYTWAKTGQTWLTLDSSTGLLHGTPPTSGAYGFDVTVIDSHQASASQGFQLNVPDLSQMGILSLFLQRHTDLVGASSTPTNGGLYGLPENDAATVDSLVSSASQQLAQVQSQPSAYGDAVRYLNAQNTVLQNFSSQLQSGVAPASWQTINSYMQQALAAHLSTASYNKDTPVQSSNNLCASAGTLCEDYWSEINFFRGDGNNYGLGTRMDSSVQGTGTSGFTSVVHDFKLSFCALGLDCSLFTSPSSNWSVIDQKFDQEATNGGTASATFTVQNPQRGTYQVSGYHRFLDDGVQTGPPFPSWTGGPTACQTTSFNPQDGSDYCQNRVDLQLQVGTQIYSTGQTAQVTSCTGPIAVQGVLTPALPAGNQAPPLTWTGGTPVDNLDRTVPCQAGETSVTASFGANLSANVTINIAPMPSITPTDVSGGDGDTFTFTATSPLQGNGNFTWEIVSMGQDGDNPNAFQFVGPSTCTNVTSCSITVQAVPGITGFAGVQVSFQVGSATPTASQPARARHIAVQITKIWSDEFPNWPITNYLPGGAGLVGNAHEILIMGARGDGNAYVKANLVTQPNNAEALSHVLARLQPGAPGIYSLTSPNPAQPIGGCSAGAGCIVGSVFSVSVPAPAFTFGSETDYSVVAGVDRRNGGQGSGTLYVQEIASTGTFTANCAVEPLSVPCSGGAVRIVSSAAVHAYCAAASAATAATGALAAYPTASAFLNAFVVPQYPSGSGLGNPTLSYASFPPLLFNTGVDFSNPTTPLFTFPLDGSGNMTPLGQHILLDTDFQTLLTDTLASHDSDVVSYFNDPANAGVTTHQFPAWVVSRPCSTSPGTPCQNGAASYFDSTPAAQVDKPPVFPCQGSPSMECDLTFSEDLDLQRAFGRVGYNMVLQATVSRSSANPQSQFTLGSMSVSGWIYDHYQWNPYMPPFTLLQQIGLNVPVYADQAMADVQAGWNALSNAGQVYQTQVYLSAPALTSINYTFQ